MQFGKSLLGAIIGAAVGIGLLLAVYLLLGIDKVWMAIPFAILTGLGVRMFVSTAGHASYVRGAMTMVIALAGYIGGWYLVAKGDDGSRQCTKSQAGRRGRRRGEASRRISRDRGQGHGSRGAERRRRASRAAESGSRRLRRSPSHDRLPRKSFGSTWDVIWLGDRGAGGVRTGPRLRDSNDASCEPDRCRPARIRTRDAFLLNLASGTRLLLSMSSPAIAAFSSDAVKPTNSARKPSRARSCRRFGAIAPMPPS